MALPRSVTRVDRAGGITFTSNVDAVQYTINELCRAALRDVAKMLRKKMILKLKKLPGMKKHRRIYKSTQYWVRRIEADLQIGFKHDTWYGVNQELGSKGMPKKGILRNTVFENIGEIRRIQAQYLSGIDSAQSVIDESEARSGDGEE
jgi:hypothetical protein